MRGQLHLRHHLHLWHEEPCLGGLWPSVTDVSPLLLLPNQRPGDCATLGNQPFLMFLKRLKKKKEKKSLPPSLRELSKSSTMPNFQKRHC